MTRKQLLLFVFFFCCVAAVVFVVLISQSIKSGNDAAVVAKMLGFAISGIAAGITLFQLLNLLDREEVKKKNENCGLS